jgi:hypothetical protein
VAIRVSANEAVILPEALSGAVIALGVGQLYRQGSEVALCLDQPHDFDEKNFLAPELLHVLCVTFITDYL